MLSNSKISTYKVKKILTCFVEDYTSTETSKLTKSNRKTIDRYYKIFRKVILQSIINILKIEPNPAQYIGYIKGAYGPKVYLKIYKLNKKVFLFTKMTKKPDDGRYAHYDEDFNKYLCYIHQRFSKFYGLTASSYYYQLYEMACRYNFTNNELFNLIWKEIKKTSSKNSLIKDKETVNI